MIAQAKAYQHAGYVYLVSIKLVVLQYVLLTLVPGLHVLLEGKYVFFCHPSFLVNVLQQICKYTPGSIYVYIDHTRYISIRPFTSFPSVSLSVFSHDMLTFFFLHFFHLAIDVNTWGGISILQATAVDLIYQGINHHLAIILVRRLLRGRRAAGRKKTAE